MGTPENENSTIPQWGPWWVAGTRHLVGLTGEEAAAVAATDKAYWLRIEKGQIIPHLRFLWAGASVALGDTSQKDRLRWWKLSVAAWWFTRPSDQFLMPVLEIGEEVLHDHFTLCDELTTRAETACLNGQWPNVVDPRPWPGLSKVQTLTIHAPEKLSQSRTRAGIRPMFFTALAWATWKAET